MPEPVTEPVTESVTEPETEPPEKPEVSKEPEEESRLTVRRANCSMSDPLERAMQQLAQSIEEVEPGGEQWLAGWLCPL